MVLPTLQSYSAVKHLTNSETTIQTKQEIEAEKKYDLYLLPTLLRVYL
jgi:hypothetical protein